MEDWAEIRRLHRAEGVPIKEIARRLGVARNTVKAALAAERLRAGDVWASNDLVFCTAVGTPLDPRNLHRSFRAMLIRSGVRVMQTADSDGKTVHRTTLRPHDLRHSCASFLLALGNSPRVVMEVLGHSGIAITMNTYAHVLPTLLRGAVDGMDDVLGGGATAR